MAATLKLAWHRGLRDCVLLLPPAMLVALVALQPWIEPSDLLRDPIAVAELKGGDCCSFYYGAISNIGVLIWATAAAIALFSGAVVAARTSWRSPRAIFFVTGGLLTAILAVDDLFLIHESALGYFGVPQPLIYGAYGAMGIAFVVTSWRQILGARPFLLLVAGLFLGASVVIDSFVHSDDTLRIVLEDGAKLLGITAWSLFFVMVSWESLSRVSGPAELGR